MKHAQWENKATEYNHSMQSNTEAEERNKMATALVGSCFHQPRFVRHRPCIEGLPKVGNDGFVDVPPVRVDLVLVSVGHLRRKK
jgi:hypothetical protein